MTPIGVAQGLRPRGDDDLLGVGGVAEDGHTRVDGFGGPVPEGVPRFAVVPTRRDRLLPSWQHNFIRLYNISNMLRYLPGRRPP